MIRRGTAIGDVETGIRTFLAQTPATFLPSVTTLARHFHCRPATVLAALDRLRCEGAVTYRRGQRVRIARQGEESADPIPVRVPRAAASESLADRIAIRISQGRYRVGKPLPKQMHFVVEEGVTSRTVTASMLSLEERGMVHKAGHRWFAGPKRSARTSFFSPPAVLIVQPSPETWQGLATPRTVKFIVSFTSEAESFGVQLLGGSMGDAPPASRRETFYDLDSLEHLGRELGTRYLGSVVVGIRDRYSALRGRAEFSQVIQRLAKFRKPVVWFDQTGAMTGLPERPKLFYRCSFSEKVLAEAAIGFLAEMGHRRVAYIRSSNEVWQMQRERLLVEAAKSRGGMHLVTHDECVARHAWASDPQLAERLRAIHQDGGNRASRVVDYLVGALWPTPVAPPDKYAALAGALAVWPRDRSALNPLAFGDSFGPGANLPALGRVDWVLPYLFDPDITALVAPRDLSAVLVAATLGLLGQAVPQDISLLSFDNYPGAAAHPITTVDIGAEDLGYRAFHAILRDIPVSTNGNGEIVARPAVARRRSVAALV